MNLRTIFFIVAGLVSGPVPIVSSPSVVTGSPLPNGYYGLVFNADKADLIPGTQNFIDRVARAPANLGAQFDVTDDKKVLHISAYDRTLSDHRAKAVAARLVADGIPKSMIKICYGTNRESGIQGPCYPQSRQLVVFMPYTPPPPPPPGVIEIP
jgi:hypothetical protein